MIYPVLRPLLFRLDPERAHDLTLTALRVTGSVWPVKRALSAFFGVSDPRLKTEMLGRTFDNPVGLAAGYDKNGVAVAGLATLGFGHVEIGTVTLKPQAGNPRPRIHRLPVDHAVINSMGFPNRGVDALRLGKVPTRVGINLGKGRDTPLDHAADDYCALLRRVHDKADYVALNLSSPNTPGLRDLQSRSRLKDLLEAVMATRRELGSTVPILVKISPDAHLDDVDGILAQAVEQGVDGIIATNTTLSREGLRTPLDAAGGLSGEPLKKRATEVVGHIAKRTEGKVPLIGVGGIASAQDALEKLRAGAWMVQVYTGLIYAGPMLVHDINVGILEDMKRLGVHSMRELHEAYAAQRAEPAKHSVNGKKNGRSAGQDWVMGHE